jgi:hypothetical protein
VQSWRSVCLFWDPGAHTLHSFPCSRLTNNYVKYFWYWYRFHLHHWLGFNVGGTWWSVSNQGWI